MTEKNTKAQQEAMAKACKALVDSAPEGSVQRKTLEVELEGFKTIFRTFIDAKSHFVDWSKIKPPPAEMVVTYNSLVEAGKKQEEAERTKLDYELLDQLVVVKLNGGLGTTMGCTGPKSVIEVTKDLTFLDLTVQQIAHLNKISGKNVPLVLMNSFNTHEETQKIVEKYQNDVKVLMFNQSCHPRFYKESLLPMPKAHNDKSTCWYPPGHGDLYEAFHNSGLLETLIKEGKKYAFVSNIDNLGATVDFNIMRHIASANVEYAMEVTDKTRADVKGGTLIDYEGKAKLLEIAQVAPKNVEEFKSIKKFKIFNTNNLWVSLPAIERLVQQNAFKDMDVIVNGKTVDGKPVIQLERAAGSAIQYFNNSIGVNVPRSRFLPVKSTSDLFIIQSNLYSLDNGSLAMNPKRSSTFPTAPLVKLGTEFTKVDGFMSRFRGIPDILELDHLTVSGDVTFGGDIVLKGTVIIVANHGSRIDIPGGSILENKVVSGNLRILDH